VRRRAREILNQVLSERRSKEFLLLECVEDMDAAFMLTDELHKASIPLVQTLYLESSRVADVLCREVQITSSQKTKRDKERNIMDRQEAWNREFARFIEYFASFQTLVEVTPSVLTSARPQEQTLPPRKIHATLAEQGYTALKNRVCIAENLALPGELAYTLLEPVISARLVTRRDEIDRVLSDAAQSSGLLLFQSQNPASLPTPKNIVRDEASCGFLSYPGRYKVCRKCDGMRYMLVIAQDGSSYYRTRSGSMYAYPSCTRSNNQASTGSPCVASSTQKSTTGSLMLPPGTVLDGEMVWIGDQGFYLAFDALMVGQERVWDRPLDERLRAFEELQLQEAEECEELRRAYAHTLSEQRACAEVGLMLACLCFAYMHIVCVSSTVCQCV
jgi:hypothetical protein